VSRLRLQSPSFWLSGNAVDFIDGIFLGWSEKYIDREKGLSVLIMEINIMLS